MKNNFVAKHNKHRSWVHEDKSKLPPKWNAYEDFEEFQQGNVLREKCGELTSAFIREQDDITLRTIFRYYRTTDIDVSWVERVLRRDETSYVDKLTGESIITWVKEYSIPPARHEINYKVELHQTYTTFDGEK